jgi:uncharacterized peroxidase-related enzyme
LLVYHVQHEAERADLQPCEREMLAFARKLNFNPARVTADDVRRLRGAGFDDRAVLDIVLVVSLFNFMNRLADGLGVEAEPHYLEQKAQGDARAEAALANPAESSATGNASRAK